MAEIVGGFLVPHVPLISSEPMMAPEDKRRAVSDSFAHLRDRLKALEVDTVVMIGDDHYTIFGPQNLPRCLVGIGEVEGPVEPWLGIPRQKVPNDGALASHIMNFGFDNGVDWAVSKSLVLDHSIMVPYHLGVAGSPDMAIVPIYLSCAVEPLISSARARAIGKITGLAVRSFPAARRVAIVGTGGLSHWVGMARMGDVNEAWDRDVIRMVQAHDLEGLIALRDEDIIAQAGNGALEIKNWIFAMAAVGQMQTEIISYNAINEWVTGCAFLELVAA
ncbi:protocatechuate 3,4-dioxygenase [Sphingomonas sp. SRS2]|uniref:DODA-type extradiol aromatic ring-opening family dioxygenase n=1 Tax=Sphingomonas sp. SRS2 TaxID=133190 RepID=UPI0006184E51|nr:protocatechuate 3,4-dioxygenase [Sphingomonas sp. SRS2]KKC26025.1 protocatechuate 3,4-dioxygenase [Sphingomonas sp. SRS2]